MMKLEDSQRVWLCMGLCLMVESTPGEYLVAAHHIALDIARDYDLEDEFFEMAQTYRDDFDDICKGLGAWKSPANRERLESLVQARSKSKRSST